jgi:RNA polymerase sigma-70 factor (ECF subfamily)
MSDGSHLYDGVASQALAVGIASRGESAVKQRLHAAARKEGRVSRDVSAHVHLVSLERERIRVVVMSLATQVQRSCGVPRLQIMKDALSTHVPFLLARARHICRNEADAYDLVQDTCLHALEALAHAGAVPENPRGWLVVIMRNHWLSVVRRRRVRANAQAALAARSSFDDGLCETRVVHSQVARLWRRLSAQARNIAQQCLIDGDSQEEVSRRLGMTAGGVAASIHRTRRVLRQSMFGVNS